MAGFFNQGTAVRLNAGVIKHIDAVVVLNPEKYYSRSHFVRCAIIRLLAEEKKRGEEVWR